MRYGYEFAIENTPYLSRLEIGSGCFSYGTKFSLGSGIPQTVLISRPPRLVHPDRRQRQHLHQGRHLHLRRVREPLGSCSRTLLIPRLQQAEHAQVR